MGDVIDHARGADADPSAPPGPADALALCCLAQCDFGALGAVRGADGMRVADLGALALSRFLYRHSLHPRLDRRMLVAAASSPRFAPLTCAHAVDRWSARPLIQFSALTLRTPGGPGSPVMVVFRGTDRSWQGWAEDAAMGLSFPLPGHRAAARYLAFTAERHPGPLFVMGHSKGGNLAEYALASLLRARPRDAERVHLFSLDAPGFPAPLVRSGFFEANAAPASRVRIPGSWVSVLLDQPGPARFVRSGLPGPMGHDPYTWVVEGGDFVPAPAPGPVPRAVGAAVDRALGLRPIRITRP